VWTSGKGRGQDTAEESENARCGCQNRQCHDALSFEEKKKPPSKLTHAIEAAPGETVVAAVHREIRQSEDDNVGVESAHKLEETAEGGVRIADSAHRNHQLKPYRNTERAEAKADKANIRALNKEAERQNPQLSSNPYSRWQQKQAIKRNMPQPRPERAHRTRSKHPKLRQRQRPRPQRPPRRPASLLPVTRKPFSSSVASPPCLCCCSMLLPPALFSLRAASLPSV
jgi:hypothetical protein